jgi:transposase
MIEKKLSIGIDISKLTLDICIIDDDVLENYCIKNKVTSIRSFVKKLKKKFGVAELELCMENTGLYNWPLYSVCEELSITAYVINPLHLKRSMGLVRGKNDKIDAERIALHARRFYDTLTPYKLPSKTIRKMQIMYALRKRIVEVKKMFNAPISELKSVAEKGVYAEMLKITNQLVKQLDNKLLRVEEELNSLITSDAQIQENYKLITSVQGVGKVLAWNLLIKTNNFKTINDPRKLACYVGVVPFDFQSGTSINKKPRVSFMADKQVKKVLHMAALRAVRLEGDLQKYYLRKVAEGKNKMSVLNAVRNKIIARVCSVVNNKKMYETNLVLS